MVSLHSRSRLQFSPQAPPKLKLRPGKRGWSLGNPYGTHGCRAVASWMSGRVCPIWKRPFFAKSDRGSAPSAAKRRHEPKCHVKHVKSFSPTTVPTQPAVAPLGTVRVAFSREPCRKGQYSVRPFSVSKIDTLDLSLQRLLMLLQYTLVVASLGSRYNTCKPLLYWPPLQDSKP